MSAGGPPPVALEPSGQFHFTVGALMRGPVRREIKSSAMSWGLDVEVEEDRGWLESLMTVRVTGPAQQVADYMIAVQDWFKRIDEKKAKEASWKQPQPPCA